MADRSKDIEKLGNCLALTASNVDGEALAAIRAAERIRAKLGVSWRDLVEQAFNGQRQAGGYNAADMAEAWGRGYARGRSSAEEEHRRREQEQRDRPTYTEDDIDWGARIDAVLARRMHQKWRDVFNDLLDFWQRNGRLSDKQKDLVMKFYRDVEEAA